MENSCNHGFINKAIREQTEYRQLKRALRSFGKDGCKLKIINGDLRVVGDYGDGHTPPKDGFSYDEKGAYYNNKLLSVRGRELVVLRLLMTEYYRNSTENIVPKYKIMEELSAYGSKIKEKNLKNIMSRIRQVLRKETSDTKIDVNGHIKNSKNPDGYYFVP